MSTPNACNERDHEDPLHVHDDLESMKTYVSDTTKQCFPDSPVCGVRWVKYSEDGITKYMACFPGIRVTYTQTETPSRLTAASHELGPHDESPSPAEPLDAPEQTDHETSQEVTIAVLDTGVDLAHPELAPFADRFSQASFIPRVGPTDRNGHGTHVVGVICGDATTPGPNRLQTPGRVHFAIGKVLSDGYAMGHPVWLLAGIQWAVQEKGARVLVLPSTSHRNRDAPIPHSWCQLFSRLNQTLVIASAGNNANRRPASPDYGSIGVPAAVANVVSVGALNRPTPPTCEGDFVAARFSPRSDNHAKITFAAPGRDVNSLWVGGGRRRLSGTSAAAAYVARKAMQVLERKACLGPSDVLDQLKDSCKSDVCRCDFGFGCPGS